MFLSPIHINLLTFVILSFPTDANNLLYAKIINFHYFIINIYKRILIKIFDIFLIFSLFFTRKANLFF